MRIGSAPAASCGGASITSVERISIDAVRFLRARLPPQAGSSRACFARRGCAATWSHRSAFPAALEDHLALRRAAGARKQRGARQGCRCQKGPEISFPVAHIDHAGSGAGRSQFAGTLETLQPADALLVVIFPAGLVAAERGVQLEQPQRPPGQSGHKPGMNQNAVTALAASAQNAFRAANAYEDVAEMEIVPGHGPLRDTMLRSGMLVKDRLPDARAHVRASRDPEGRRRGAASILHGRASLNDLVLHVRLPGADRRGPRAFQHPLLI